jgi:hypothetical protein
MLIELISIYSCMQPKQFERTKPTERRGATLTFCCTALDTMDAGWPVAEPTPDFEWPPPANPSTMSSAASSPVHEEMIVDDCTPLDPGLEAALKDESMECDFAGFGPEDVENREL